MLATLVELAAKCLSIVAAVILSHNKSELPHYRQSGGKCPGKSGARPGRKVASVRRNLHVATAII